MNRWETCVEVTDDMYTMTLLTCYDVLFRWEMCGEMSDDVYTMTRYEVL